MSDIFPDVVTNGTLSLSAPLGIHDRGMMSVLPNERLP